MDLTHSDSDDDVINCDPLVKTIDAIYSMPTVRHRLYRSFVEDFSDPDVTVQGHAVLSFVMHKMYTTWSPELQKQCVIILDSDTWDLHIAHLYKRDSKRDMRARRQRSIMSYPEGWPNKEFIIILSINSSHFSLWIIHNAFCAGQIAQLCVLDSVSHNTRRSRDAVKVCNWLDIHRDPNQRSLGTMYQEKSDQLHVRCVAMPLQPRESGLCAFFVLMNLHLFGSDEGFRAALSDSSTSDLAMKWKAAYKVGEVELAREKWAEWLQPDAEDKAEEQIGQDTETHGA